MKSSNITDTEARLGNILTNISTNTIEKTVPQQIEKAMEDVFIKTGTIVRFYPYADKALVKMDLTGEKELCKILHRYGGDVLELYTPSSASGGFDTNYHEPFVTPKAKLNVCVLKIRDEDSEENLILGYYMDKEIVGYSPAKPGNIKLTSLAEDGDENWIKFGKMGFQYKLRKTPNMKVGSNFNKKGFEQVEYVNNGDVYTKDEVGRLVRQLSNRIKVLEAQLNVTPPVEDTCDPNIPNPPNTAPYNWNLSPTTTVTVTTNNNTDTSSTDTNNDTSNNNGGG